MDAGTHETPSPRSSTLPLSGRVIVVTGGARGIGRGIVEAVIAAGGKAIIGDVDPRAGRACLAELNAGAHLAFLRVDVSREASVRRFVIAALFRYGRIDGLVNAAGIADPRDGPLETLDWKTWSRRIETNLGGTFLCSKHCLPELRKRGGAIVNIGSSRAQQSEPGTEAYAASKGGVIAFTHALAVSAGPVRVNAINPGGIVCGEAHEPVTDMDTVCHPVGRRGLPGDIGALAVFLLSPQAGFITGESFTVDGGMRRKRA
ncbi:MAG TPA: SDR family oxidoreductase [Luteibacter sp.]|jgi:NAD(P)-dependent dehydrogenase (short-subunit alcohol dehydrogenase family)|nr:SDR family oxidoreductase [Luteibacter sp.]